MRRVLAIALIVAIAAAPRAEESGERIVLAGGVEFRAPPGFSVDGERTSFQMTQQGVRAPLVVTVMTARFQSLIFEDNSRETPYGPARWQLREYETGASGGPEWRLRIDHPLVTVVANQQREGGPPDFSVVWEIVETIKKAPTD